MLADQVSGIRSGIRYQRSGIKGSAISGQGSGVKGQGSGIGNQESGIRDQITTATLFDPTDPTDLTHQAAPTDYVRPRALRMASAYLRAPARFG